MVLQTDAFRNRQTHHQNRTLIKPLQRLLGEPGPAPPWDDHAPIRGELFSVERLEDHARSLAAAQVVSQGEQRGARLDRRLAENEAVLVEAYRDTAGAVAAGAAITPAAEWLIDNFYVIERQIRDVRADLPPGYYRQLPKLAGGPFAGYPRVFGVAWAFVAHTDSLFEPRYLSRFLRAYQEVQPLTIGELWAVAITLRIVLIENLRRIARRIVDSRAGRAEADLVADRLLGVGDQPGEPAEKVLPPHEAVSYPDSFLVQLVHRLRDQDPTIAPALTWLDDQLAKQNTSAEAVVRDEQQRQVTSTATVRNIINSMRLISDVDWAELFEGSALVDDVLRACGSFDQMDFPTRNLYRNAIERLARSSRLNELEVARAAVTAAQRAPGARSGEDARLNHEAERLGDAGYYLVGRGLRDFERDIGYRSSPLESIGRAYQGLGIGGYVISGWVLAAAILCFALAAVDQGRVSTLYLIALGVLGAVPALDLAVTLLNYFLTHAYRATLLPSLDLRRGIPETLKTLVVVPTMLTSHKSVAEQVERLEIHFLASQRGALHFALLSDWRDAPSEHMDDDGALLAAAKEGIAALNGRHGPGPDGGDRFLLLHRGRRWSESEGKWMGWERKRGKLSELNRILRGARDTSFLDPPPTPPDVRYVITLDADTQLPRDTVGRLIGKMAHPLNRPLYDRRLGRVVDGYGIMQPRVTPAFQMGRGSLFQRVFSSASGIDPYAAAVSDVYQDLFGEGTFTGKGIYDIDAFDAALDGRVPEAAVLSHDLFEGVFARAALVSDVEVVEAFPSRYDVAALRSHRWARGDWQLLPWILGLIGTRPKGAPSTGPSAIGRWKMVDNLRRSLSPPMLVLALIAGWGLPLAEAMAWTLFIVLTLILPQLLTPLAGLFSRPEGPLAGLSRSFWSDVRLAFLNTGLTIAFLAHQAWSMADAVARTLFRLAITRRRLLEWVPADQAAFSPTPSLGSFGARMAGAVIVCAGGVAFLALARSPSWPVAGLFIAAWLASPLIAVRASLTPVADPEGALGADDTTALRLIARQTWRYFETFVTPAQNNLPPDNFQEFPQSVVAHRTSPTNIGVYLLSVTAARDLGWIGASEALDRLEATFATLATMTRFKGHFLNWYDTRDLRPLDPPYVSSVDSGNLAGHLIALANACREWRDGAVPPPQQVQGVEDALALARWSIASTNGQPALVDDSVIEAMRAFDAALANAGSGDEPTQTNLRAQAASLCEAVRRGVVADKHPAATDVLFWVEAAQATLDSHWRDRVADAAALRGRLEALEQVARSTAMGMEFDFLLDPSRLLLTIGYQVRENLPDPNCYDLLASEARLASFFAIAKGDAPARHWFRLSHAVTRVGDGAALISWSGSMFEYLMPSLVIRSPTESLIAETNRLIVRRQIEYGAALNTPWGISESAYNARDRELTYQYTNFGVPGLGLKRGLGVNTVIAPYATALASMVDPVAAARNFARLESLGARGRYGFYEAIDFTASRLPDDVPMAVVRAYMAHHQGMTITAIADALLDGVLRTRFHAEPMIQATELLLQERVPRDATALTPSVSDAVSPENVKVLAKQRVWRTANPWGATPATQLLSNGRYTVMLTAAGSGYSAWRDLAVTRWREDIASDDFGSYIFLRDVASGEAWSATYQPFGAEPDAYSVVFNEDNAKFERRDGTLTTTLEVVVSAEDDAEVRRITLLNRGQEPRELEVTSFAELVLGPKAADDAHPAFSKMFVQTEDAPHLGALLATRRRRTPNEPEMWAAHVAVTDATALGRREFETDRALFLGRGRTIRAPIAATNGRPLAGTTGAVLDPMFALRRRLRIPPGGTARIDFWTMVGSSREQIIDLIDKHQSPSAFERAGGLARTQVQVQLQHLGVDPEAAGQFQRLAGHVLYAGPEFRAPSDDIAAGRGSQPGLWSLGISGDLPIVLVRIADADQLGLAREALQAVDHWRMKRLGVDLVILNERASSYMQELEASLETLVRASQSRSQFDDDRPPGHIFILRADQISPETMRLLISVARIVLSGDRGGIADQLDRASRSRPPRRKIERPGRSQSELRPPEPEQGLEFFNGLGGFANGGREYLTVLGPGQTTPAPWINVIANAEFGFQVSAEGAGFTWSVNSRERQLTPWSNDAATDRPGQVFYIRDEDTGDLWTPTALPMRDPAGRYTARHGWGYSQFEHTAHGVSASLLEFTPRVDAVKISRLKLVNTTTVERRLSITAYVEWVLGSTRSSSAPFVSTELDAETRAMFATNAWNAAFASRVAFVDMSGRQTHWTGDRREFIGRNGALDRPASLVNGGALTGRVGSGLDPCGALQTTIVLPAGGSAEIDVFLGDAPGHDEARGLVQRCRTLDVGAALAEVKQFWEETCGAVQVKTPDRSMDIVLNGWLLYQTLSCRMWGRTGFYQVSGAFGFRDQLQDSMAVAPVRPAIAREHLLRAGSRQFVEGDVQHWWLPHSGQGVRTRISDDRGWLAFTAAHYVRVTGDHGVLEESLPFLEGRQLKPEEADGFFMPDVSAKVASLYEHCALALDASLAMGPHGLPLFGAGDWNDGFNRVGAGGKGESVWLGWFLCAALRDFVGFARARGDTDRVKRWEAEIDTMGVQLEQEAWDGGWYKRGWFDDGAPLGSATSDECRIDCIAQSWSVISGVARPDRARIAMEAVERDLIRPHDGLALLFTPSFDRSALDPGYVKGYPAGLRENGGQYTHGAVWSVVALAELGEGDKAAALFALLNPINHARTPTDVMRYKVEPYVSVADVYSATGQIGRGGWSWYTGSGAWLHRAGLESVLGVNIESGKLRLSPCIPRSWPGFEVSLRRGGSVYRVVVTNPHGVQRGVASAILDGEAITDRPLLISLNDDGRDHRLEVTLGDPEADHSHPSL